MSTKIYTCAELRELELQYAKDNNLSVKNIKTFAGHDGMLGVNADIYQNNKKFAHFYDDARGGEAEVSYLGKNDIEMQKNRNILRDLETQFKAYPTVKFTYKESDDEHENTFYFSHVVNTLINSELERKELARDAKKGIVYMDPKDEQTYIWSWSYNLPKLFQIYPTKALSTVQKACDELKAEGCIIKNVDLLKEYGVSL